MKKNKLLIGLLLLGVLSITACKGGETSSGSESISGTSGSSTSQRSSKSMDDEEVRRYMEELKPTSVPGHLYVHYYRFTPSANEYNAFDVWAWPYRPKASEGYRFDWKGRTQSGDRMSATGDPVIDKFGYVVADIDLTKTDYDGGWDDVNKRMGGKPMDFLTADKSAIDEQIGVQLVVSATRKTTKPGSFWDNDGGNIYLKLENFLLEGTESYHAFFVQDDAQEPTPIPKTSQDIDDPFKDDDGTNVTYGDPKYKDADWKDKPIAATSNKFKGIGVGYQIMVSSFADSDGDGNGDIYGIEQKLDYLQGLGVQALWLTPIQLSDSYHGYDISDYLAVDPKFGSKVSPAGELAGGTTSEATALADYKSLIDAAHAKGMVVIMDLVLNHTSTTNKWFIRSAQLNEELRGYYQWGNHETNPTKINQDKYWYPYGTHCYSYYAKFGSSMPELNYAYKSTREAVEDVALNWCEFGVDGFRMDAVKHIFIRDEIDIDNNDTYVMDESVSGDYSSDLTKNLNFWRELNSVVKAQYPDCFFVGENFDGSAYHVAPYYEGFDSLFDFYSYFNITSLAARAGLNGSTGAYTGDCSQWIGASGTQYPYKVTADKYPLVDATTGSKTGLLWPQGGTCRVRYEGNWNIADVMNANNQYRSGSKANDTTGYQAINGCFTSNHDIARCINRVAATKFDLNGITEQGEVSSSTYQKMNELATCVQIAELMMPGLTWIYYGDELGMTGNLQGKKSTDGYADFAYRQPMKWVENGKVGDGSYTCGYDVTGSGTGVKLDNVNSTAAVAPAITQVGKSNSHYASLAAFAKLKGSTKTLTIGNFVPYGWTGNQFILNFARKLGGETYNVTINFGNTEASCALGGTVKASYNGATANKLPARSAIVVKL